MANRISGFEVARSRLRSRHCHPTAGFSLRRLLEDRAARLGGRPFLIWEPFDAKPQTWTYSEFAASVRNVAGNLWYRGVRPGDRILLHMNNRPEFLLAWFGCAWIGAVSVCTNTRSATA